MIKQSKIRDKEYETIELKISEEDADDIKMLESGAHLHFQIEDTKEVIITKR